MYMTTESYEHYP